MDGRVFLRFKELRHSHSSRLGKAAHIVSKQIDDHQVLGPFFFGFQQDIKNGFVFPARPAARRGAFHRLRTDARIVDAKEQFR